jgi:hypothetical protein
VLRIPGFLNRKRGEPHHMVRTVAGDARSYTRAQILGAFPPLLRRTRSGTVAGGSGEERSELVRKVVTGESYHGPLTALAWRDIGAGQPAGQVVESLRGLMLACPAGWWAGGAGCHPGRGGKSLA